MKRIVKFPLTQDSLQKPENIQVLNDLLSQLVWLLPALNDSVGQVEPTANFLRAGALAYADGFNWNPGSGQGLYYYTGSAWVKIINLSDVPAAVTEFKIGSFTRNMTTASGTQAVTGVGFVPRLLVFLAAKSSGIDYSGSVGFDDGTSKFCIATYLYAGAYMAWTNSAAASILYPNAPGVTQYAGYASSLDADGFTITWTRTGAPSGTLTTYYLAIR